ncbi:MAG TPA: DALR anticodon-binding domain-containing protein, partial [Patescibacteria group bacterium]|nr:DALR anticodon-binding domain-containing protein [Patescibacteria group bacterium]
GGEDDLVRLLARVDALKGFLDSEDGANLLTAYRRAANIVRIEEKKDGVSYRAFAPSADASRVAEEEALFQALDEASAKFHAALAGENFAAAMAEVSKLRGPVDAFFDRVTVNSADPAEREQRLRLLGQVCGVMDVVADFSQVEG